MKNRDIVNINISSGLFNVLLSILFIALKLTKVINWSWWIVLLPLYWWIPLFLILLVVLVIYRLIVKD